MMLLRLNDAGVPAVRVPALNVTVRTLDIKVACATGLLEMPLKPETVMAVVDVNPVRVTTTLLKLATLVGVKVTVTAAGVVPATALANVTPKDLNDGVIASNVPDAVVSRTFSPAKVAAAIVVDAARGTLGLIMLLRANDAGVPAVRVPAVNVTVRTLDVNVACATGLFKMPLKSETAIVVVDVNPVRVTTTLLNEVMKVGVNVILCIPFDAVAAVCVRVTLILGLVGGAHVSSWVKDPVSV